MDNDEIFAGHGDKLLLIMQRHKLTSTSKEILKMRFKVHTWLSQEWFGYSGRGPDKYKTKSAEIYG